MEQKTPEEAWRDLILKIGYSFKLDKVCDWLSKILNNKRSRIATYVISFILMFTFFVLLNIYGQ